MILRVLASNINIPVTQQWSIFFGSLIMLIGLLKYFTRSIAGKD